MDPMNETAGLAGIEMFIGTPEEVGDKLADMQAKCVIALGLKDDSDPAVNAWLNIFTDLMPFVFLTLQHRRNEALRTIVDALLPQVAFPTQLLDESIMAVSARGRMLESGDWLTAAQVAGMAGSSGAHPNAQPNRWKKHGLVFTIRHRNVDYFPGYALDPKSGYRPTRTLAEVMAVFGDSKKDWGLAYWFASANSFLGGKRPQDILLEDPDRVINAARDETASISHG